MDWRVLIVLTPLLIAGGWAVFNIGTPLLDKLNSFSANKVNKSLYFLVKPDRLRRSVFNFSFLNYEL
jgi:photosystem II PsbY protein